MKLSTGLHLLDFVSSWVDTMILFTMKTKLTHYKTEVTLVMVSL